MSGKETLEYLNKTYFRRAEFLSRVSASIFGFLLAVALDNLSHEGLLAVVGGPKAPSYTRDSIIMFLVLSVFSILYLLYRYFAVDCRRRLDWANRGLLRYLLVGIIDCLSSRLPYLGYYIGYVCILPQLPP